MKNTLISIILFCLLLGFVMYTNISLEKLCYNVTSKCETIEDYLNNNNWDLAYIESKDVLIEIEENALLSSIYLNHCDFDNLHNEAIKLTQYIKYNDISESNAAVSILKISAQNIKNLNKPTIENIF